MECTTIQSSRTDDSCAGSNNHRRIRSGAVIAVAVLLASGQGYRMTAARLASATTTVSIPKGSLAVLPMQMADWMGEDAPLEKAIVERSDTDDHVNRVYKRMNGREAIAVFFAYGIRMRDLLPHRPEVCYPGAGWTLEKSRMVELVTRGGRPLPCRIFDFHKGGLQTDRVTVLNYFVVDGNYHADISELRAIAWAPSKAGRYVARVQITSLTDTGQGSGEAMVRGYAVDSADAMRDILSQAVNTAMPIPAPPGDGITGAG